MANKVQFLGFKRVSQSVFDAVTPQKKEQYLWFVKPDGDSINETGDIWLGSYHYGHYGHADADNIQAAFFDHGFDRCIGLCTVFLSESLCPVRLYIIDRAQLTSVNFLISSGMEGTDLPASDDPCTYCFFHKL